MGNPNKKIICVALRLAADPDPNKLARSELLFRPLVYTQNFPQKVTKTHKTLTQKVLFFVLFC